MAEIAAMIGKPTRWVGCKVTKWVPFALSLTFAPDFKGSKGELLTPSKPQCRAGFILAI
jgi:hypothetical protein